MFADYHIHTEFSDDCIYPMENVVKDAILLGINELCFTDHVDYGIKRDWDDPRGIEFRSGSKGEPRNRAISNVDYPRYFKKIAELQTKYGDRVTIKKGLEFGMQTSTIAQFEKLFSQHNLDFVILSVHQVNGEEFWNNEFLESRTQREYNEQYYEEILALTESYHNYSVLGHLDQIQRYDRAGKYPYEKLKPILEKILKTVISDGKGIEVNTSSHRYNVGDLTPSRDILRLYKDLGGKVLTIGSDSHKQEHLGAFIEETKKELKDMGFKDYCTFENMNPIFHQL